MELIELFKELVDRKGSDIHLVVGEPPVYRIRGELVRRDGPVLTDADVEALLLPHLCEEQRAILQQQARDADFSLHAEGHVWRCLVFRTRGHLGVALRPIPQQVPTLDQLGFGEASALYAITRYPHGLVFITGPTGSGKATTCAAMIETINRTQARRILTVEEPIEYVFKSDKGLVTQHQVGQDVDSMAHGTRMAFHSDLDVILIGEIRDLETLQLALSLAETGHLVFTTLHTLNAVQTVDRVIDVFPEAQRSLIRRILARNLAAIISQQLLTRADRPGRVAANEILIATPRIRRMILDGRTDLSVAIEAGREEGMQTMDDSVLSLYHSGTISLETAWNSLENVERLGPELVKA